MTGPFGAVLLVALFLDRNGLVVIELVVVVLFDPEVGPGFLRVYELLVVVRLVLEDLSKEYPLVSALVVLFIFQRLLFLLTLWNVYRVMSLYIDFVDLEKTLHHFVGDGDRAVVVLRKGGRILGLDIFEYFVHVGF